MELVNWYKKCLNQYADFSGRARRREFWMFALANFVVTCILGVLIGILGKWSASLSGLYELFILLPSLAVGARRLHDIGKSGWYLLVNLIPVVGWIWLLILWCTDSQAASNKWGANPKA